MIEHKEHFHGSDLEKIEAVFGIKKEDIISFSANVNPLGISPMMRQAMIDHIDCVTGYPDREYTALRKSIAAYTGTDPSHIIVGNGSSELINLFIQLIAPKKAMIIAPTYSEYERSVSLVGGESIYFHLLEENDFVLDTEALMKAVNAETELLVICNPNNPTSAAVTTGELRRILTRCKETGTFVLIDETYAEFAEDVNAISAIPLSGEFDNFAVLRGISKFFAAPGLRLGYAITSNAELSHRIDTEKNPWTINSLAALAGEVMFRDTEYMNRVKTLMSTERARMEAAFKAIPSVKVYHPEANFMLMKILKKDVDAQMLFEHAIRQGMMIRNCDSFEGLDQSFFRFCFMNPDQNDRLVACLSELL